MSRIFYILFCIAIFSPARIFAQYYSAGADVGRLLESDSAALHLTVDNYNFLWNNEFFGDIVEGYTLIGYNLQPMLEYHFTSQIKAKMGVRLTQYSGLDKYTDCLPAYSVTWHTDKLAVTMGNISGASFHRLPDPVLNRERQLINNYENGMQVVYNTNTIFADVWVDWQEFIFHGDNKKEEIFGGLSVQWEPIKTDRLEFELPASLCIYHKGGQIDTDTSNMKLIYNVAAGFRLSALNSGFVNKVTVGTQLIGYKDNSPTPESLYGSGWGWLSDVRLTHNTSYLSVGYWYADKYLAAQGSPMFQCQSYDAGKNQPKRNLITCEANLSKNVTNYFTMALIACGYYDTKKSTFDYTYAFTMILQPDFTLWRKW